MSRRFWSLPFPLICVPLMLTLLPAIGCDRGGGSAPVAVAAPVAEGPQSDEPSPTKPVGKAERDPSTVVDAKPTDDPTDKTVENQDAPQAGQNELAQADTPAGHPFPRRQPAPSLEGGIEWINTAGPLELKDLRGKFVILDFWTYCCINCMHILPELKKLEHKYPNELVVIGVHSAKFDAEKDSKNIREAVLRYEIEHPVVNDAEHRLWQKYFVQSWPSLRVIDPEGNVVAAHSGEIDFDSLDAFMKAGLPYYRRKGVIDRTPLKFDMEAAQAKRTPLRFPGKVLADEASGRLFISDSNHNRIVITDLDGKLLETIGSGAMGHDDGAYDVATFDHPQGMALVDQTLYVADTENHMLRKIDLENKRVETIAGTGQQNRTGWPGMEKLRRNPAAKVPDRWVGSPRRTALNSPWALWVHQRDLYIAMAGPHQIWKMTLNEREIGPYAGNGREDIVDGPLLPKKPYDLGFSSFAQPSGLASDGTWLYVADSEGSSIRAVPFDPTKRVETVVGTSHLPGGRLFTFGDVDGQGEEVRLQHVLGVVHHEGKLYIADTYNNKIKEIDLKERACRTLTGTGNPGRGDNPAEFDEPSGVTFAAGRLYIADTNNHAIRVLDLHKNNEVTTLAIEGLKPPTPPATKSDAKPSFPLAQRVKVRPQTVKVVDEKITISVELTLPFGWKINTLAPQQYYLEFSEDSGPIDRTSAEKLITLDKPVKKFDITLPVSAATGEDTLELSLRYYYCKDGAEGLCKTGSVIWTVPLTLSADAKASSATVGFEVK